MRRDLVRGARAAAWHVVLAASVLLLTFPVLWATFSSLRGPADIFSASPFAGPLSLDNYGRVLSSWPVGRLFANTAVMAVGVTLGQLIVAVLAAFALVHLRMRGRRMVLALLTVSVAVPPQAVVVPQFLLAARLGWQNTDLGLIVPQLASSGLAILLLVQHTRAIPLELVEAARADGARQAQVLRHVIVPGLVPAILAVGILTFISTWNEYLWPLLIAPRSADTTVQIGLQQFVTAEGNDYGGLLAAATLTSLPIVAVYLIASRRITDAFLQAGLR